MTTEANYERHYGDDRYEASNITITNATEYPVILGDQSDGNNNITSSSLVTDFGKNNKVARTGVTD
jgi:hypothetical protein